MKNELSRNDIEKIQNIIDLRTSGSTAKSISSIFNLPEPAIYAFFTVLVSIGCKNVPITRRSLGRNLTPEQRKMDMASRAKTNRAAIVADAMAWRAAQKAAASQGLIKASDASPETDV